ncbi:NADH-quinone oxidoreductase subunit NuoN [Ottowia sp.]|uniref:NADH-quinone oxidoreductase subunit NuoN n=1 Tax=Ottowia sp. TaxID=1898956 RepID=UPI0025D5D20D|nr:NADH-quinone oxidoreductase subunit NuoN [Ottowia sp.]MBK6613828.1 NADH-quinone oxidoreductase subunit NuoN [Ottowia sp.]
MIDRFSWMAIYPELVLLVMACVIALLDLLDKRLGRPVAYILSVLTLLVLAVLSGLYASSGQTVYGFDGLVVSDPMANWLKCFAALALLVTFVYGRSYVADRGMLRGGEWFVLGLLSLLGVFVMISAGNFIVLYLGLECLTLASYALVALRRDHTTSVEAAMKYFVLGAMASGFLLYGLSMLYGATGTLDIAGVFKAIASGQIKHQVLVFGLVFVVAGVAFKFGAAPFHMWIPDVYHGAPTAVTLMLGAAPKLAAFSMAIRLLVEGLLPLAIDWQQMLGLMAIASLLIGNLAAIAQTNLKRMLAYSTIAQMGFVLLGLMAGVVNGNALSAANAYSSAMFYIVTYVLTTLASFGVIMLLSREGFESDDIADFAGLNQRSPLYAGIMAVCLFSLAGIPPLVGFQAKLSVLQALVSTNLPAYIGLAVFAVVMSLIGAFYYLRVVKVMYFDEPTSTSSISAPLDMRAVLSLNGALVLVLGIVPGALMTLCAQAIVQMLAT